MPPRQSPWSATLRERLDCFTIPEPNSGCHLWTGAVLSTGYGKVSWQGKQLPAHRASWEAHRGPVPDGKHVLHKCDVRACINPDHLFLGTQAENMADMFKKGRGITPRPKKTPYFKALHAELAQLRLENAEMAKELARHRDLHPSSSPDLIREEMARALERAYSELSALVPGPQEPDFSMACPNSADAECVSLAYAAIRTALSSHRGRK